MTTTWADAYGVWHVRVSRYVTNPIQAASDALRDELTAREAHCSPRVWECPQWVPALSTADSVVYREGDPA